MPRSPARRPAARLRGLATWAALAGRRVILSAHTPREVLAPLVTPLLFALVIAPALAKMIPQAGPGGADYSTFVIVGSVGLLIPLTCTFAGIGVIVDRASSARRELLAAPISRSLIVLGNMAVAIAVSLLQVAVLIVAGWLRGSHFDATAGGAGWFIGAVLLFTVFMYAVAEILANRIPTQEEYVGLTPVVATPALVPCGFAVPDHRAPRLAPPGPRARRGAASGFGGMLSLRLVGGEAAAQALLDAVQLPYVAPSLGGVKTLITRPATTSHAGMSPEDRERLARR